MAIKTYNVLYFNGHFYQKENKRRLIPNPSSEFAIVAQPADFLEQDIFNTPPPLLSAESKKAALLKEKDLEKYVLLLPEGSKLYFRLGISKTDRNEHGAYWCFCVRYIERAYGDAGEQNSDSYRKVAKVDYRKELNETTFQKFSKLRETRKKVAAEEGISAFIIFTDEELAALAKLDEITEKNMLGIKGIGEKKYESHLNEGLWT